MTTDEIIHGLEQCLGCACANPTDTVNAAIFALRSLEAAQKNAPLMVEAVHLLRGWRRTFEEGRHGNSPINSTRDWLSRFDASLEQPK